jgi:hypothetical protein
MFSSRLLYFCFLFLICIPGPHLSAQDVTLKGRVTEYGTNDGMPYVNIYFKGTVSGTTTDFEGYYSLKCSFSSDSLTARYLGYRTRSKRIRNTDKVQQVDFQLVKDAKMLDGVVIHPGINPALRIVQNAIDNKKKYDKESLDNIHYKSYTKTEADIDNMTKKIRRWKILHPLVSMYDSMDVVAGESKANLPVYFSEVVSDVYYQKDPRKKRENVKAVHMNFVGKKDGSAASQLTGSDFDNYNFYGENVEILKKPFLSPVADNAMNFYRYYLLDSMFIGKHYCYKINVIPRNLHDAAFKGLIWIADSSWVLMQVDLEIPKEANFDLVERVHIQQELLPTSAGPWMPSKTRVLIDYIDLTENFVSMVQKIYQSSYEYVVNEPVNGEFFEKSTDFAEDALLKKPAYWDSLRPEPLSRLEEMNFRVIDTVRSIPVVKGAVNTLYFLFMGYVTAGPIDFGHYINAYSFNNYEGNRVRLGFRTNDKLSKNWIFRGYGAYGFQDKGWKYNLQLERIISRFPWTKAGIEYRDDIERVGTAFDYSTGQSIGNANNALYMTSYVFGDLRQFVRKNEARGWYESDLNKGLTERITFQNIRTFPLFPFSFGNDPFNIFQQRNYSITELIFNTRLSMGDLFIQNGNERMKFGSSKKPVFNFNYTLGIKSLLGSDFGYHKLSLSVNQLVKWGILGTTSYSLTLGKVFSPVPYTLLEIHRGNETPFFSSTAFNQMNYFEFVSDQFLEVHLQHYFMGLVFNRIPLIKNWNLREVLTCNAVYGSLSNNNRDFNRNNIFSELNKKPYVEVGAGITNIFDILRFDFIYRATYNDAQYIRQYQIQNSGYGIQNWGVKVSFQFML